MPDVFRLAYIDLATASLDRAASYYTEVLGATVTEKGADQVFLSLGLDHHNIVLQAGPEPALNAIGLQVSRGVDLVDLQKRLNRLSIVSTLQTDRRPGVHSLLAVPDVGGHTFHLFEDMEQPAPGFAASGIVPLRLGHVAVLTPESDAILAFLSDIGFVQTDWFEDQVTFLTCNRDHHVMNVIQAPMSGLHHAAFELRGFEHHVRAVDTLAGKKRPVLWGPSRHTAGHNLATYHHGPDELLIELYTEMDVLVPDLGSFEPKPWHETLPMRPQRWRLDQMTAWETRFEFDFLTVSWGVRRPPSVNLTEAGVGSC